MTIIKLNPDVMTGEKPPLEPGPGCWIGGGAVRRWFNGGETLADVDFFGKSKDALEQFRKDRLAAMEQVGENQNAQTFSNGKLTAQLIIGKPFPTVEAMFDGFDFTLCQFAWTSEGIFTTDKAIISVLRKHLAIHKITKEYAVDSLRRAFKYQRKGYQPCLGTLRDLAAIMQSLTKEEAEKQIAISPGGGSRIVRFD